MDYKSAMAARRVHNTSPAASLGALTRAVEDANMAVFYAREAAERARRNAELAEEIGAPDWPDVADIIESAKPGDDGFSFDEFIPGARELYRRALARLARAQSAAEAAEAAYFAALRRLAHEQAHADAALLLVRLTPRVPRPRALRCQRRSVRLSAQAAAGSGADGPASPRRARLSRVHPPAKGGAPV